MTFFFLLCAFILFQSTLPVWGATFPVPLPLCSVVISIHAPRVGSDGVLHKYHPLPSYFNPRSPCGERLDFTRILLLDLTISIHAPRVGSDSEGRPPRSHSHDFNPRSPCGERRLPFFAHCSMCRISIHAPRVGSDSEKTNILFEFSVFQCIICCFSKNTYTLMIEYHIGSRMKSAFFGANLSKKSVHLLFASKQDRVFRHICTFTAEVIYFALIPVSKVIEPQTVLFHIHYTAKFRLQAAALSCVQQAFKYRALNPLTIVDTLFGNLTQPLSSGCILCIYIIGN